jgi:hypothetical protein
MLRTTMMLMLFSTSATAQGYEPFPERTPSTTPTPYAVDVYSGETSGRQIYLPDESPLLPYKNRLGEIELPGVTDTDDPFKKRRVVPE